MIGLFIALALLGSSIALFGDTPPTKAKPPKNVPPVNSPGVLEANLSENWGVIPLPIRKLAMLAELASGIPGLARPLAIHWWAMWRGTEPVVDMTQAAEMASKSPTLGLEAFEVDAANAGRLDQLMKQGFPKPKLIDGWAAGRYGLGLVPGATAVYIGSEDAKSSGWHRSLLPLIDLDAEVAMARGDVQAWIGAIEAWHALTGKTTGNTATIAPDAGNTWANVFSAVADPKAYAAGQGMAAKERFIARAKEAGIDLAALFAPTVKPGPLQPTKGVWARLQAFKDLPWIDTSLDDGVEPAQPPVQPPKVPPLPPPLPPVIPPLPLKLIGGITGLELSTEKPATAALPMIVLLHGRDGDVPDLAALLPPDLAARAFVLRGSLPTAGGFRYAEIALDSPGGAASLRHASALVAASISKLLKERPTTRLILVGFDEGGAIALRLAATGMADAAVVAGAALPTTLYPARPSQASIAIVNGTKDPWPALATFDAFANAGFATAWRSVEGVGHDLLALAPVVREEVSVTFAKLPLIETSGFTWGEGCKLKVTDPGAAMRYLVPRVLEQAQGKPLTVEALAVMALEYLSVNDKMCEFPMKLIPLDAEGAVKLFLLERQLITTLLTRGQLPTQIGVELVSNARETAISYGAPAGQLPQIEV